jgi:hypothetical protein
MSKPKADWATVGTLQGEATELRRRAAALRERSAELSNGLAPQRSDLARHTKALAETQLGIRLAQGEVIANASGRLAPISTPKRRERLPVVPAALKDPNDLERQAAAALARLKDTPLHERHRALGEALKLKTLAMEARARAELAMTDRDSAVLSIPHLESLGADLRHRIAVLEAELQEPMQALSRLQDEISKLEIQASQTEAGRSEIEARLLGQPGEAAA